MRKKGLNALELIFTLFVLIVVVLVVIKMFINRMNFNEVKPVEDVKESFKYSAALSKCNSLCEDYMQDKSNYNALRFCQQKIGIDIDGDGKVGQEAAYGVLVGIPLCEDGIYCFHIKECGSGSVALDAERCLMDMCRYYEIDNGLPEDTAIQLIKERVHYGTCKADITDWRRMVDNYNPVTVPAYDSDWRNGITKMGPDYWWVQAGYNSPDCENIQRGTTTTTTSTTIPQSLTLSCERSGDDLKCTWTNCYFEAGEEGILVVNVKGRSSEFYHFISLGAVSSSYTFKNPDLTLDKTYTVLINCGESITDTQVTW